MHQESKGGKVICLVGVDGSGKTSHALRIVSRLRESGERCRYIWFGTPYFLSYPFMAMCSVLGLTEAHRLPNNATWSEHKYYQVRPIALMWPWVQFLDLVVFVFLRVYVSLWFRFSVVCDRFVYDILVELMTDVGDSRLHEKSVGQLILRLRPRSALVYLMDVSEDTALRRKRDIPNMRYLIRRRDLFRLIARKHNIHVVDADRPFPLVDEELLGIQKTVFGSGDQSVR